MFERLTYVNIIQPTLNVMLSKYRITKALQKKKRSVRWITKSRNRMKINRKKKKIIHSLAKKKTHWSHVSSETGNVQKKECQLSLAKHQNIYGISDGSTWNSIANALQIQCKMMQNAKGKKCRRKKYLLPNVYIDSKWLKYWTAIIYDCTNTTVHTYRWWGRHMHVYVEYKVLTFFPSPLF